MASPPNIGGHLLSNNANINNNNIKKSGYLKKQKHGHKRYFVLRESSEGSPARLEYYESEKKWKNKSAPKRVIPLDCCLNINKRADAKHKHLIALYTKDEYFAVAAENELEQENWYRVLADLMGEVKVHEGSASDSASSLVGFDEANYGMITPVTAAYKEVWQVNLKSKGLGQSRNLTGVFRLCLSSRTISFVKLNSEVASVILQLMNIRRCGHSDSFFFIEVGRSAATGPGELWMQADDSVVAQNIHETILEAMKAMKELSEFRPRSKSQSSSTNPISVPTRRHLNNLPPSQTGLLRRSRTESMAATSPVSKFSSCRIRTASEGDGSMTRPMSVNGSPLSPGVHRTLLGRSNTITARPCRTFESSSLQHSKSMSMPVSPAPSPGLAATPNSTGRSSCGEIREVGIGGGLLHHHRHTGSSSCCSASPSPSDAGFLSCEEYGSSPADLRLTLHSTTPESLGADTPPGREAAALHGYMVMERGNSHHANGHHANGHHGGYRPLSELEKAYRRRTYSLTTPRQQRATPQLSSASLDEYTLMRATYATGQDRRSPRAMHPEEGEGGADAGLLGDSGYMPMTPGVALPGTAAVAGKDEAYVPMSAMCVSAPKQIINPRSHPSPTGPGPKTESPSSLSLEDAGYMRMWCGHRMSVDCTDSRLASGGYLNMSPVDQLVSLTPPDYIVNGNGDVVTPLPRRQAYNAGTRLLKTPPQRDEADGEGYVVMTLQRQSIQEESNYCPLSPSTPTPPPSTPTPPSSSEPSPLRVGGQGEPGQLWRGRASRPTRLALESLRTLPCMSEHPLHPPLPEPRSPGEYVNIDFSRTADTSPRESLPLSSDSDVGPHGSIHRGDSQGGDRQIEEEDDNEGRGTGVVNEEAETATQPSGLLKDDYTEMTFSPVGLPPPSLSCLLADAPTPLLSLPSPTSSTCIQRLAVEVDSPAPILPPVPVEAFFLGGPSLSLIPSPDPDRGAKVIRADPQGRRRHSSETFSSTTTVTPVCPSFAHEAKRHSSASVENVWRSVRSSDGSDDEYSSGGGGGSPMCRETSTGFQNGLNYIALNLMEGGLGGCGTLGGCEGLLRYKTACGCKGGMNGFNAGPFASLGFNETATAVKD